jgi:DNA-binding FadR family transcriptional regulator
MKPQRVRLREQLVLHLAEEIISGRLKVGDSLSAEPELARTFGISKVVLREAIQELASHGLLHVQHGKHTKVLGQANWNVLAQPVQVAYRQSGAASDLTKQLYDVRLILELSAVELAAEHRTREELRELNLLVDSMREIARTTRDVPAFLISDRAFHDVIGRATGNMVLRAMMRDLHHLLAANWDGSRTLPAQLEFLAEQHAAIAEAIRARDARTALARMRAHLQSAKKIETTRTDELSQRRLNQPELSRSRNVRQQHRG